jgi:serine/threonine protein kinase
MAEVFLAARPDLGSRELVVIKRLHGRDDDNDPALERMLRDEARIAVRLVHPNIVRTFGIGTLAGRHALVMEFLEGQPLQKVLRRLAERGERVPIEVFVPLFADALDGLHAAHESKGDDGRSLGVIHRDVSPHNLFLTSTGVLKLLDFGIAKTALQEDRTRTGLLKGKVSYMAPEQALGEAVDRRADIWSLGVVLWETLAGTRLFKADNEAASLRLTLMGEVRTLNSVRPQLPPALGAIVARALQRDPNARYSSAAEMAGALRKFAADHAISHWNDGQKLMDSLFAAEFLEQRQRIATFFANGDAAPTSGTVPARMLPLPLPGTSTSVARSPGNTQVSALNELANEHERHGRRKLGTLGTVLVPFVLVAFVLTYVLLVRAPSDVSVPVTKAAPHVVVPVPARASSVSSVSPVPTLTAVPSSRALVATPAPATAGAVRANAVGTGGPTPVRASLKGPPPGVLETATPGRGTVEFGYLTLDTSPWANVSVGGSSLGQTPLVRAKLPAGTHTVHMTNPERGISTTYQVTIQPGKTSVRRLGLD